MAPCLLYYVADISDLLQSLCRVALSRGCLLATIWGGSLCSPRRRHTRRRIRSKERGNSEYPDLPGNPNLVWWETPGKMLCRGSVLASCVMDELSLQYDGRPRAQLE